jgi:hypothetical protein
MSDSPAAVLVDSDGNFAGYLGDRQKVYVGADTPETAIYVISTKGAQRFHMDYMVNSALPASVEAGASGPYDVGGTDLTVTVDGGSPQTVSFATRAATKGRARGGTNPYPKDGWPNQEHKLKVSIDGGALTEVQIAKTYTDWDGVASALQTEIRSSVPNGTSVIVEYNSTEFPLRMAIWSGTTGASSSVHVEKADDLAKDMQLMVGYDYEEIAGTDADHYLNDEVLAQMNEDLQGATADSEPPVITTKSTGTSATVQVSSGGANTELQFPTTQATGQNGTGSSDLSEDGSTTALYYTVPVPADEVFVVQKLVFLMRCNSANLNKFGGIDELTNGVEVEIRQEDQPLQSAFTVVTNGELFGYADDGEVLVDAYDGGDELIKATVDFGENGVRLRYGTTDRLQLIVQDDLSDSDKMVWFKVFAKGWLE